MKPTHLAAGCRGCGRPWGDAQLVWRQPDGTWLTTCPECGASQAWTWLYLLDPTNKEAT